MAKRSLKERFTRNVYLFFITDVLYFTALMFMKDSIIQAFLVHYGVSEHLIGIYTTVLNIINVTVLFLSPVVSGSAKNPISAMVKMSIPMGLLFFGLLPICFFSDSLAVGGVFAIALTVGITQYILYSMREVFAYKLPYKIYDMRDYSLVVSVNGIVYSVFGIAASWVFAQLTKAYDYERVIAGAFVFSAVTMILSAFVMSRMKTIDPSVNAVLSSGGKEKTASFKELLIMPEFKSMIVPNFARGLFTGALGMTAVTAMNVGFTETDVAEIVILQQVASIVGSLVFCVLAEKINSRYLCFGGSLLTLFMPLLSIHSKGLFFAVYSVVYLAKMMVDYAVPTVISRVISYEVAGSYHSWRLLIMSMGTAVSSYLVGAILTAGVIPVWLMLAVASACEVACGIGYCFAGPMKTRYVEKMLGR